MTEPAIQDDLYQRFLAVPDIMVAEILYGQLVTHPRPAPKHSMAASALGSELFASFHHGKTGPGGWIILFEPELHLGSDILVPDIAGWKRENLPHLPETAWFETPPDWICEVLSPSTTRYDRLEKREIYGRNNVSHLWLIDPEVRTFEAFELQGENWVLLKTLSNHDEVAINPFAAAPFSLADLWFDDNNSTS